MAVTKVARATVVILATMAETSLVVPIIKVEMAAISSNTLRRGTSTEAAEVKATFSKPRSPTTTMPLVPQLVMLSIIRDLRLLILPPSKSVVELNLATETTQNSTELLHSLLNSASQK
jgi:hypothetical protein